ncbi:MAG: ClbS/DfsB family four-helix bundle protein [Planctomycetota bacterium]
MAATNKTELLEILHKEYAKLQKLIDPIDEADALVKDDDVSIKDIIGHRAHWMALFLGWYRDGMAEKPVAFPAEGYKWNELNRYNADLRAHQADLSWADAKAMLHTKCEELVAMLETLSNDALYGGPMKGANNKWTAGRWAEAAGPSHFRSAAKYIRARLRASTK